MYVLNCKKFFYIADRNCRMFAGSTIEHTYTFNPIKEFIDVDYDYLDSSLDKFKKEHNKEYDLREHSYRKEIFKQNLKY